MIMPYHFLQHFGNCGLQSCSFNRFLLIVWSLYITDIKHFNWDHRFYLFIDNLYSQSPVTILSSLDKIVDKERLGWNCFWKTVLQIFSLGWLRFLRQRKARLKLFWKKNLQILLLGWLRSKTLCPSLWSQFLCIHVSKRKVSDLKADVKRRECPVLS